MGNELRRNPRVAGYAKALLADGSVPGYIRDLSRSGCQVAFIQSVSVAPGDVVSVRVIAEHDPSIAPFEVRLRVRWVKPDEIWFAMGGELERVTEPTDRAAFEKLVDYYAGPAP